MNKAFFFLIVCLIFLYINQSIKNIYILLLFGDIWNKKLKITPFDSGGIWTHINAHYVYKFHLRDNIYSQFIFIFLYIPYDMYIIQSIDCLVSISMGDYFIIKHWNNWIQILRNMHLYDGHVIFSILTYKYDYSSIIFIIIFIINFSINIEIYHNITCWLKLYYTNTVERVI